MKIRTIKPDLWANEKLSTVSEPAMLMAIGLLNYCDDEGYFNAHPGLVRAALFPLREPSKSIPGLLEELGSIGFVQFGCGSDGRTYGWVSSFRNHQKISHPSASKIRDLVVAWGPSWVSPGIVPEDSGALRKIPEASGNDFDAPRRAQEASGNGSQEVEGKGREGEAADAAPPAPFELIPPEIDPDRLTPTRLAELWNREVGGKLATDLVDDRLAAAKRAIKRRPREADWLPALAKARQIRALADTKWLDFDWLVRDSSHPERLVSGAFDFKLEKASNQPKPREEVSAAYRAGSL